MVKFFEENEENEETEVSKEHNVELADSRTGYPWKEAAEGTSFCVSAEGLNEKSFRTMVSNKSKALGVKFSCVKHAEQNVFEVSLSTKNNATREWTLCPSSPEMKALILKNTLEELILTITFEKSLPVPCNIISEKDLKTMLRIILQKYKKDFIFIKHDAHGLYEVSTSRPNASYFLSSYVESSEEMRKALLKINCEQILEEAPYNHSVVFKFDEIDEEELNQTCNKVNEKTGRRFKIFKNEQTGGFEIFDFRGFPDGKIMEMTNTLKEFLNNLKEN